MDSDEVESILYIAREISVYKIPPLKKNEGHRANEWGDLAQPLWKGRLRIIEKSSGATMLFEDSQTGELFASTEYKVESPCVEAVLDSSRYFVIRLENEGKKAYIGMGFAERTDSFDFNVALQDYTKRQKALSSPPSAVEAAVVSNTPKKDYTLKEGQTFSISIPGRKKASTTQGSNLLGGLGGFGNDDGSKSNTASSGFPLLPPPPSSTKRRN